VKLDKKTLVSKEYFLNITTKSQILQHFFPVQLKTL